MIAGMSPGLPATVQPEVVVIRDGRSSLGTAAVSNEEEEEDSDPELEGAVGGVGISDQQVCDGRSHGSSRESKILATLTAHIVCALCACSALVCVVFVLCIHSCLYAVHSSLCGVHLCLCAMGSSLCVCCALIIVYYGFITVCVCVP